MSSGMWILAVILAAKLDAEGFGQMLIPIGVNGHTFWCSADSGGSRVLSLDLVKARRAGLEPNATGSSAGVGPDVNRDQRVRGATVTVGSIALNNVTVVLAQRPTVVPDINCVFGLGLLPDAIVEFDYAAPAVRVMAPADFHPSAAAIAIPLSLDRSATPSIPARLRLGDTDEFVDLRLMVDTGASYYDVVLLKPFIDAHAVTDHLKPVVSRFTDTPGMQLSAARAAALAVGPFEIGGPIAALISTSSGGLYTVDGLLGAGFLKRFKVAFDYPRQQLWLEPTGRSRGPQPFDGSGIEVRPSGTGAFRIVAIAPDSPAAAANLQVGDLLETIDGRAVRDMSLGEISDAFSRAGATCRVTIERDGRAATAMLRLVPRL